MAKRRAVFRNPGRQLAYAAPAPFGTLPDLRVDFEHVDALGPHMVWSSRAHGVVATFPWWDRPDLARFFADAHWSPVGTEKMPFIDAEQNWFFKSWRDEKFVYWVEGIDGASWERRLRVPVEVFDRAWREARVRAASQLESGPRG